jgi:hypothetical protein
MYLTYRIRVPYCGTGVTGRCEMHKSHLYGHRFKLEFGFAGGKVCYRSGYNRIGNYKGRAGMDPHAPLAEVTQWKG